MKKDPEQDKTLRQLRELVERVRRGEVTALSVITTPKSRRRPARKKAPES